MSEPKHTYPEGYEPGTGELSSRYGDAAWDVLDMLKPGVLSENTRWFVAGLIAGRIEKCVQDALNGVFPEQGKSRPVSSVIRTESKS